MSERRYYLSDYTDETNPCDCTLEGWAKWLSEPDEGWGRDEAAAAGETFRASVMEFLPSIEVAKTGGAFSLKDVPHGDFYALRFGPGWGWSSDMIADDRADLLAMLQEQGGEVAHVAVGLNRPAVTLRFLNDAEGPRLEVLKEDA